MERLKIGERVMLTAALPLVIFAALGIFWGSMKWHESAQVDNLLSNSVIAEHSINVLNALRAEQTASALFQERRTFEGFKDDLQNQRQTTDQALKTFAQLIAEMPGEALTVELVNAQNHLNSLPEHRAEVDYGRASLAENASFYDGVSQYLTDAMTANMSRHLKAYAQTKQAETHWLIDFGVLLFAVASACALIFAASAKRSLAQIEDLLDTMNGDDGVAVATELPPGISERSETGKMVLASGKYHALHNEFQELEHSIKEEQSNKAQRQSKTEQLLDRFKSRTAEILQSFESELESKYSQPHNLMSSAAAEDGSAQDLENATDINAVTSSVQEVSRKLAASANQFLKEANSDGAERRRSQRIKTQEAVVIFADGYRLTTTMFDFSMTGARILANDKLRIGLEVTLVWHNGTNARGTVVWIRNGMAAVHFIEALKELPWIEAI